MHAVTPYLIKSYHQYNKDKKEQEYFSLNSIRGKDTLEIIHKFMESKSSSVFDFPSESRVYKFENIEFNPKNRTVSAFLIAGFYGVKSDILDKNTGEIRFPNP